MSKTLVAVYGSLRKGHGNNDLLVRGGAEFICTTRTKSKFAMYSLGGFPFVSLTEHKVPITVEVYEVDSHCLARLDCLEGYREGSGDSFYNRSQVNLENLDKPAFIYHIDNRTNQSPVTSGDWNEYKSPNRPV